MTNWPETAKEFQPAIVGTIGFVGVIITLIANSWKDRSLHRWKNLQEQKAIVAGLRSELAMIVDTLKVNISSLTSYQQGTTLFIHKTLFAPIFFPTCGRNIALLPSQVMGPVIKAYILLEEHPSLDSPVGFGRPARKPQECWRNRGIVLSPVASARIGRPFQRKNLNLCRESALHAGKALIHPGNPGLEGLYLQPPIKREFVICRKYLELIIF